MQTAVRIKLLKEMENAPAGFCKPRTQRIENKQNADVSIRTTTQAWTLTHVSPREQAVNADIAADVLSTSNSAKVQ